MGRDRPDQILGVSYGSSQSGFFAKEFFKLGKKDDDVTTALIKGNLSPKEAALLGLIRDLAPDDSGTSSAITHYVATTMGINGRAQRMALMDDSGVMVPEWEKQLAQQPGTGATKFTKEYQEPPPTHGHNGHNGVMTGEYRR